MVYNRFLYNTALWNAGREEVPAIARSIIQAHTGPHVKAVIGASGGTTLISDFIITEGTVKKPPTQYKFPDLSAFIRAYQISPSSEGTADGLAKDDLRAFLTAWQFKDLPACVFIVHHAPDLQAIIYGLHQADLSATITEKLFNKITISDTKDLPALLQVLPVIVDLRASLTGSGGYGNLGARIFAPKDLPAILTPVIRDLLGDQYDLAGVIQTFHRAQITAFIRTVIGGIADLPARSSARDFGQLSATILSSLTAASEDVIAFVRAFVEDQNDLAAVINFIGQTGDLDLPAIIQWFSAKNLSATIGASAEGERDRYLNAFAQPAHFTNLGATMTLSENVSFLGASIRSLRETQDLSAVIKVAETFVTAILTISTLVGRDLRATIGNPACAGGSANAVLGATATVQHAKNLSAALQSFVEKNLGAVVNSEQIFFAYDTIDVAFTPFKQPIAPGFEATDTIPILFSPFRGKNLGAIITTVQNNVLLGASIDAVYPLPRVVPAINRLTALDLRLNEPQNLQEIRLQLEGALLEYIYVNGTDDSFIKDANEIWQINIRSFKSIAEGLFGDHAAAKISRLGSLTRFNTMDEAVRFCIQTVLGFEAQANMSASITATGYFDTLNALIGASTTFGDLNASASRVFPANLGADITGIP